MHFKVQMIIISICYFICLPLFSEKASSIQKKAQELNFKKKYIKTNCFTLTTFYRFKKNSDTIRIYIEGDGCAWSDKNSLSLDPTPKRPIALSLAMCDNFDSVAYIARPGQFSYAKCNSRYWSSCRFASEVTDAIDYVIDILKQKCKAKNIEIIGYSGGGALAILIAAKRNDIISIRTIAGNLNLKLFCSYHKVSPLIGSLDPFDVAQRVSKIPQRHFVGSKDKVVPDFIVLSFIKKEGINENDCFTIVDGATHMDKWATIWKSLLLIPLKL